MFLFFSYCNQLIFSSYLAEFEAPHESQTNNEIVETINRKGLGGFDPGSPNDGDDDYALDDVGSPHNGGGGGGGGDGVGGGQGGSHIEDNEFQSLLHQRNQLNANPGKLTGNQVVSPKLALIVLVHLY